MFVSYCIGNIIAPQFFISSEAPGYQTAFRAILSAITIGMVCVMIYGFGVYYENRKRSTDDSTEGASNQALLDVTDKEKKGFVYIY
jgi:hypothetical protein